MNLGSETKRTRRLSRRTKSGCLPCRRRRKKCDESKPKCQGCLRNHLICAWSFSDSVISAKSNEESEPEPSPLLNPQISSQSFRSMENGSITSISCLPPTFRNPEAAHLLHSFIGLTAPRMVGKGDIENPFITYNLRIALQSTAPQHALLAVSSCHRAYSEPTLSLSSHGHYAVALRSLKLGITKWYSCSVEDRVALLASCLTLCWYEVIDADIRGSLYYHLRASKSMIRDLQKDTRLQDNYFLGFFSEQYSYLAIVASIGTGQDRLDRLMDLGFLPHPLKALNGDTPIYGFMFGYAHGLFEIIPRIACLSIKYKAQEISYGDIQGEYESITTAIRGWVSESTTNDPAYDLAGQMYRAACLVFLITSIRLRGERPEQLCEQLEPYINLFLCSFERLSGESPPWTTFMWPTLVVGSCMKEKSQRQLLLQLLNGSGLRMQTVDSTAQWLSLHWAQMDRDSKLYGIDGLEKTMSDQGLDPCIG